MISVALYGPFTLNGFADWPFSQCQRSPGAYIEFMLGGQRIFSFMGNTKQVKDF